MFEFFSFNKSKKTLELKKCNFTKTQTLKNNKYLNLFKQSVLSSVALILVLLAPLQRADAIVELGMIVSRPQECLSFFSQSIKTQEAIQTPRAIVLANPKVSLQQQQPQQISNAPQVHTVALENTESGPIVNVGNSRDTNTSQASISNTQSMQGSVSTQTLTVETQTSQQIATANSGGTKDVSGDLKTISTVYEGIKEFNKISSNYKPFSDALAKLTKFNSEKNQINSEIQSFEKQFKSIREAIEKEKKISSNQLQKLQSLFEKYNRVFANLAEVKTAYDLLDEDGKAYLSSSFTMTLNFLTQLANQLVNLKGGKPTSLMVQDEIKLLRDLESIEVVLSQTQSVQMSLHQSYSLMMLQKSQLLMEVRKYSDLFKKYEDDSILDLDNQLGPSELVAEGVENFNLEFEFAIKKTVFGFKTLFIPKGKKIRNKNIASLNPNISIMGISRGTFFKNKNKLYAVVGFFPDSTVLVDVINPSKNKSKLKRMKLSEIHGFEKISTSGVNRPIVYGDTYYLENESYVLGKSRALDYLDPKKLNGINRTLLSALDNSANVLILSGVSSSPIIALTSGVISFVSQYPIQFAAGITGAAWISHIGYNLYLIAKGAMKNFKSFFEYAEGNHHHLNDYSRILRSKTVTLDISELSQREQLELKGPAVDFFISYASGLNMELEATRVNKGNIKLSENQIKNLSIEAFKQRKEGDFGVGVGFYGELRRLKEVIHDISNKFPSVQKYLAFEERLEAGNTDHINYELERIESLPHKVSEELGNKIKFILESALNKGKQDVKTRSFYESIEDSELVNHFSYSNFQSPILFAVMNYLEGRERPIEHYLKLAFEFMTTTDMEYRFRTQIYFQLVLSELLGQSLDLDLIALQAESLKLNYMPADKNPLQTKIPVRPLSLEELPPFPENQKF